jgi:hypothetical protein
MKSAHKFFNSLIAFVLVLAFSVVFVPSVHAAQLTGAKDSLSDSRPSTSSTHTFTFTTNSAGTLREIRFVYATTASGSASKPSGLDLTSTSLGSLTNLDANWTLDTSNGGSGTLKLQHTVTGEVIGSGEVIGIPLQSITNHAIDDCQAAGDTSSDTCFVRLTTYSDLGTTSVDTGIVTYTVVAAVTVTARVDPQFTFVVAGVNADTVNDGITTSVASTFSTLPFGNLTASTPKYMAHQLTVTTNSNSGYTVTMKMLSQMTGTYSANNIDPFGGGSWAAPAAWSEPNGTGANTDTGWIGANTTDADITQFDASEFGPVQSTANTVMSSTASDDGSTSVYVTYAIEANVYQPADTYTGTLVYNAIPTY